MEQKTPTRKRARQVKPWTALALVLGMALLGYYAFLGFRLLNYGSQEQALGAEMKRLSQSQRPPPNDVELLRMGLAAAEKALTETSALYAAQQPDQLVRLIVDTALDAGLELGQVAVGETATERIGDVRYAVQPLDLWISGNLTQVVSFLDILQRRAPTADIVKVGLRGLQDKPVADIKVVFYHSPVYIAGKETKDGKTDNSQPGGR